MKQELKLGWWWLGEKTDQMAASQAEAEEG